MLVLGGDVGTIDADPLEEVRRLLGLTGSLVGRYGAFLLGLVSLNFGDSTPC